MADSIGDLVDGRGFAMADAELQQRIAAVRRFNRFYTQRIGVLQEGWLDSPFSLTEARVLYELAHRDKPTATAVANDLGLDAGYLSRMLQRFHKQGLIRKDASPADGRQSLLSMTAKGRKAFAPLETHANDEVAAMLGGLPEGTQHRLLAPMQAIEESLRRTGETDAPYILREPKPGDFGWVVSRHATLYGEEYGWGGPFEGLCAQIVADFVNKYDPTRELCWIAERDGENVGSIFVVKDSDGVARMRLLLVDPKARGFGIGVRLVEESIAFARQTGYRKLTLWTHSVLTAARNIYERAGFKLVESKPHNSWGKEVVGETWDLEL